MPSTFAFSQASHDAGKSAGTNATDAGEYFRFRIEDLSRATGSSPNWRLKYENFNDRNDLEKFCLSLRDTIAVNADSFTTSTHPVNYIVADGVSWCGRVREFTYEGWVVQDRHMGVFFHTRELRKGPGSTNQARTKRTYVRCQIDQNGFALRAKQADYTDNVETIPWNTAPSDPVLVAEDGFDTMDTTIFLNNDQWYWVSITATIVANEYMNYHAVLKTGPSGTLIAEIGADRTDGLAEAYGGFGFFTYSENGSGSHKRDRWSGWTMEGTVKDHNVNPPNGTGCRPPCEYEPPLLSGRVR